MRILAALVFIPCLFLSSAFAQDSPSDYPSLSLHFGGFYTAQKNFEKTFGANPMFVYGGGVDFPIITHVRLTGKLTYFFKTGNNYEWRQWLIRGGGSYCLDVADNIGVTFSGGMALTVFLETQPVVTVLGRTSGNMIPGFYAGAGGEYHLAGFPLTVFLEADFSYLPWNFTTYTHNYGGTDLSLGLRYHFVH